MDTDAPKAPTDSGTAITEDRIREELKNVMDPEIGLDVINLGLIYDVKVDGSAVSILMTLTSPGCPVAGMFLANVRSAVEAIPGVAACTVDLTFTPPWDPRSHASEEAKMMLGLYY